jgi:hypothetical protein
MKGHATSVHGEFERRLVSFRAGMFTSDIKLIRSVMLIATGILFLVVPFAYGAKILKIELELVLVLDCPRIW